jgi:hypothetical protein
VDANGKLEMSNREDNDVAVLARDVEVYRLLKFSGEAVGAR